MVRHVGGPLRRAFRDFRIFQASTFPNAGAQPRAAMRGDVPVRRARRVGCSALFAVRRRETHHERSDDRLSPERSPRNSPSTEISSSSSGQWMPTPEPIKTHARRSRGEASARRGYHVVGTDTTRPSASSKVSDWSVTRTRRAAAFVGDAKVLMPRLPDLSFVLKHQTGQSFRLPFAEANARREANRRQPELRQLSLAHNVHVRRFRPVARKEEESIRSALEDGRTHNGLILPVLPQGFHQSCPANDRHQPQREPSRRRRFALSAPSRG